MSKKIEFEGKVVSYLYSALGYDGKDVSEVKILAAGKLSERVLIGRYRITLEPLEPELGPCPFCGGENAEPLHQIGDRWRVQCVERPPHQIACAAGPTENTKQQAIEAWNRRAN